MTLSIKEIAEQVNGSVDHKFLEIAIDRVDKIEDATAGSITFLARDDYEKYLYNCEASAVLVKKSFVPKEALDIALIKVDDPYQSLVRVLHNFNAEEALVKGLSSLAFIDNTAIIGEDVSLGPFAHIGGGTSIGKDVKIHSQVYIGNDCVIGQACVILPGAKIFRNTVIGDHCIIGPNAVIGSDGFGYAPDAKGIFHKIPQVGKVVLGNSVEIGACTVIDRATMGNTIIYDYAKLDNLIQVAHNVSIGEKTMIAAQAGIAGSARIGIQCQIGGQVGIVGHIEIADGTKIQAQSGVASSVKKKGQAVFGSPAIGYNDYIRAYIHFKNLPEIEKRIRNLEQRINSLDQTDRTA